MRPYLWVAAAIATVCVVAWSQGSPRRYVIPQAKHVTLILVDNLTAKDLIDDPAFGKLIGSSYTIGLVSPGLPRPPDPKANLYATVTAGDVVNTRNKQSGLLTRIAHSPAGRARLRIIEFGDARRSGGLARLERLLPRIDPDLVLPTSIPTSFISDRTIVVGVTPPLVHGYWYTLTPILYPGAMFDMSKGFGRPRLTSATTQTPDLIALRDVAPTVLHEAGLPVPAAMSGAPLEIESFDWQSDWNYVTRLETLTELNEQILLPMAWTYGLVSGAALLGALAGALGYFPRQRSIIRYLLRYLFACPLALLLAPLPLWFGWVPMTLPNYGVLTAIVPLAIAALPVRWICLLTGAVLIGDGFSGTHMVAMSSLSGYWLSGIRFYGIGNEYMGVLVGMSLVASLELVGDEGRSISTGSALALAVWFAVTAFVLSFPAFGAKAGGAIVALAAFIPAWHGLVRRNPLRWPVFAWSTIAGFALIFVWTIVANHLGVRHTHIQAAASAAVHGKIGYIWHIALRKAKLAVRTALVPGVITTLIGMIPVVWLWNRTALKRRASEFLTTRPKMNAVMRAAIGAVVPTLLFNDSGVVAIVFLFGTSAMYLLYSMLGDVCESLPSTLATSVSASP